LAALWHFTRLAAAGPNAQRWHVYRVGAATALLKCGRRKEAINAFSDLIREAPDDMALRGARGVALREAGHWRAAADLVFTARGSRDFDPWKDAAAVLAMAGDLES
jgi:hypothetical protein